MKITIGDLRKKWSEFRNACIPINSPEIYLDNMRASFYMGALGLLILVDDNTDESLLLSVMEEITDATKNTIH